MAMRSRRKLSNREENGASAWELPRWDRWTVFETVDVFP
uniref:Uncharacterized protein n=1 Tax=Arundo donax TaxID=35708 RepID=A0A0A9B6B5_ARUDO